MNFYNVHYGSGSPDNINTPCIILMSDNWNDWGFRTLFHMKYVDENNVEVELGSVKILEMDEGTTSLPDSFEELGKNYYSLGQSLDYYEAISQLPEYVDILKGLRDVIFNEELLSQIESNEIYETSLLRNSEAREAVHKGKMFFDKNVDVEKDVLLNFIFTTEFSEANGPHRLEFNFNNEEFLPNRINLIIGKNGTGKTQLLARIANSLSGFKVKNQGKFGPEKPSFSRVIAVSYSAFDVFEKPTSTRDVSYKYCGLRDNNNQLNPDLANEMSNLIEDIEVMGRLEKWKTIISEIIEVDNIDPFIRNLKRKQGINMSSGQNFIITALTNVIANIKPNSLLLFDEPELYLHPNFITMLINALNELLREFDSYAIVSTHSPIILQSIPSRYVNVIERINNVPYVHRPEIECFGENLTTITNDIFGIQDTLTNYKNILFSMKERGLGYEEINELFENKLSVNARIFIRNILAGNEGR